MDVRCILLFLAVLFFGTLILISKIEPNQPQAEVINRDLVSDLIACQKQMIELERECNSSFNRRD